MTNDEGSIYSPVVRIAVSSVGESQNGKGMTDRTVVLLGCWLILVSSIAYGDSDLIVQMSDAPDPVTMGTDLTYAIVIINAGPAAAKDLELSDSLPNSMAFESLKAPEEWACTTPQLGVPGVITCRMAGLEPNQTFTLMVVVKPISLGVVTNVATLTSTDPDPDSSNNQVSEETTVVTGTGGPPRPGW